LRRKSGKVEKWVRIGDGVGWDDMIFIFSKSLLLAGEKSISDNFMLHE